MNVLYCELHTHSYYSLLDGAASPEALAQRAAALEMPALALTDHDALYGAVSFQQAAQAVGVRPIHGAELTLEDGRHVTLLVQNALGWRNLCALITAGRHNAPKGNSCVPEGLLEAHAEGLLLLTGCRRGLMYGRDEAAALATLARWRSWFGGRVWVEMQHHLLRGDAARIERLARVAQQVRVGVVATNNVHYAEQHDHELHDVLTCIRHHTTLDEAGSLLRPNSEFFLKSGAAMQALFAAYPEAVANTQAVAEQCSYQIEATLQDLPEYPHVGFDSATAYLRHLCLTSTRADEVLRQQAEAELRVIERAGLSNYFLVVWDIVRYARACGIPCQGRGSAANSAVAYLLFISPINPLRYDLVFERFLSTERQTVPDIDIDIDAARREEVIQYVYQRYGQAHAAMACTFITYRAQSALRDVGRAMGYAPSVIDLWSQSVDGWMTRSVDQALVQIPEPVKAMCRRIAGLPRHLSIHNGGMIVTREPLSQRLPHEPATMEDRTVVQWDKQGLEDSGLVKIDLLGLRMLSAIREAVALSGADLDALSYDEAAVFRMISLAETLGVFQVESRAQAQMLPRFQPRTFDDLIIAISLIRPGPLQGQMVHPYLRRRTGQEPVEYLHPLLEPALRETLGVILFQEQVLKVARDLAGFTAGEGELLRRALGRKNAVEALGGFEAQFIAGACARGVKPELARRVFEKLLGFGSYSFPKSHAAAFAVLVYQSAWLRLYHPTAFYVALLNNQPMGFWHPAQLLNDAKRRGLRVLPVDVQHSQPRCSVEGEAIRVGLNYVKGLTAAQVERLCAGRPYVDLADMCRRSRLPRRSVEQLIQSGACDAWGERRALLWQVGSVAAELALVMERDAPAPDLPELTWLDALSMEQAVLGLNTGQHIMARLRDALDERGVLSSVELRTAEAGARVTVAGLVVVRQAPPTAKGFRFLTLEDEYGFINVIVCPAAYEQHRRTLRSSSLLVVQGEVQREGRVTNVMMQGVDGVLRE